MPNYPYGLPGFFGCLGDDSRKKPLGSRTNNENVAEFISVLCYAVAKK